jgi:hypothetical protein
MKKDKIVEIKENDVLDILLQRKQKTEDEINGVQAAMYSLTERRIGLINQKNLIDELIVSVTKEMPSQKPETDKK